VTWTWAAGASFHNITFEDGQGNIAGNLSSLVSHQRTFPSVGSSTPFRYRCTLHSANFTSGMSGVITVVP
jgi:plastocyanin